MITHWTFFALCSCLLICSILFFFIQCTPFYIIWDLEKLASYTSMPSCWNRNTLIIILNVWHIVTDAVLLVTPFAMLWNVQMKLSIKLRVWMVGIVGSMNIVVSILRTLANNGIARDSTCKEFPLRTPSKAPFYPLQPQSQPPYFNGILE